MKFGSLSIFSSARECDGCGECARACQEVMSHTGEHPAMQLVEMDGQHTPVLCRNCHDAPCVTACMPGCRYKDENSGRVITDYARCVGCWMCVMVCPFGAIQRLPAKEGEHHGKALKCDGCIGHEQTPCISACRKEVLKESRPQLLANERRQAAAMSIGNACRHDEGGATHGYQDDQE